MDLDDQRFLEAAEGWLMLGNWHEANEELERIAPERRALPEVLKVRSKVYTQAKRWPVCFELGNALVKLTPDDPFGWIIRSQALHEQKQTEKAFDLLEAAAGKFGKNSMIPYNLACYAAQLGRLDEAREWLAEAINVGDKKDLRLLALDRRNPARFHFLASKPEL